MWHAAQAKRDNERVYFQAVPAPGALAPIEPRRLTSLTAYALPPPAPLVTQALQDAFVEVPPKQARSCYWAACSSVLAHSLHAHFMRHCNVCHSAC